MAISDLLRTDIHLASLLGKFDEREDFFVVRTPENPGFFYGNLLVLKEEPKELEVWLEAFEEVFGAETRHRCIAWSGQELGKELSVEAERLGLDPEGGADMAMDVMPPENLKWKVRPLVSASDWVASDALSLEADVTELVGDDSYVAFKDGLRTTRKGWVEKGVATWWGAFDGEQLIGQCGMVECDELGRYQAVETHPDWRRQGVCSSLISTVARHAFETLGKQRLLLSAEIDGPALELYKRLGFRETGQTHSVLKHRMPLKVRDEQSGDHAGVRSLTRAAFKGPAEAKLIELLRDSEGVISLVAEQTNSLFGQILFSKVTIEGTGSALSAVALAPLSVSPNWQGRGVGSTLVREGLEQCKSAGHDICIVLGSHDYYSRFGFVPAAPHGLINPWGGDDQNFMVHELTAGALAKCAGTPIYHEAFSAV